MRLCYLSILGEPGTYDASVYADLPGGDDECAWIRGRFGYLADVEIGGARVSHGEAIPDPASADAFILGGSYNSVHDDFPWQRALLAWFGELRAADKPLLGICGGHQLLSQFAGAAVTGVAEAPIAGTHSVGLTEAGRAAPLFAGLTDPATFHFANFEQVAAPPAGARILAATDRLPAAALDYGGNWYSVQFHPEADAHGLAISWAPTRPDLAAAYRDHPDGTRVIENFVALARR